MLQRHQVTSVNPPSITVDRSRISAGSPGSPGLTRGDRIGRGAPPVRFRKSRSFRVPLGLISSTKAKSTETYRRVAERGQLKATRCVEVTGSCFSGSCERMERDGLAGDGSWDCWDCSVAVAAAASTQSSMVHMFVTIPAIL